MKTIFHLPQFWFIIAGLILLALAIILIPLLKKKSSQSRLFILFFVPLFNVGVLFFYHQWGASHQLVDDAALKQLSEALAEISQEPDAPKDKILEKFNALETKLGYSAPVLGQLGSIYNQLGLSDKAIEVYAKAMDLDPQSPDYLVQWVYSYSLKEQGKLPSDIRNQAEKYIQKDPSQKNLFNLLAIDDYLRGNYSQAIQAWQHLIETDEALTDEKRQALEKAVEKAHSLVTAS